MALATTGATSVNFKEGLVGKYSAAYPTSLTIDPLTNTVTVSVPALNPVFTNLKVGILL